jgi:hypothetical protein
VDCVLGGKGGRELSEGILERDCDPVSGTSSTVSVIGDRKEYCGFDLGMTSSSDDSLRRMVSLSEDSTLTRAARDIWTVDLCDLGIGT